MSYRELLWGNEMFYEGDPKDYFRSLLETKTHFPAPEKIAFCLLSVPSEPNKQGQNVVDSIENVRKDLKDYTTPARVFLGDIEYWNNGYTDLYDIEQPIILLQEIVNCCARPPIGMADDNLNKVLRQDVKEGTFKQSTIDLINTRIQSVMAPISVVNLFVISEQCYEHIKQNCVHMPNMVRGIFRYNTISSEDAHLLEVIKRDSNLLKKIEEYLHPSKVDSKTYPGEERLFEEKKTEEYNKAK